MAWRHIRRIRMSSHLRSFRVFADERIRKGCVFCRTVSCCRYECGLHLGEKLAGSKDSGQRARRHNRRSDEHTWSGHM
eukprot:49679-Eustigmatos_ZCMA.PRE.1